MSLKIFWLLYRSSEARMNWNIADDISLRLKHCKRLKNSVQKGGYCFLASICVRTVSRIWIEIKVTELNASLK